MSCGRCKDCRHWRKHAADPGRFGFCSEIEHAGDHPMWAGRDAMARSYPDRLAATMGGGEVEFDREPYLVTRDDFGCALFEGAGR